MSNTFQVLIKSKLCSKSIISDKIKDILVKLKYISQCTQFKWFHLIRHPMHENDQSTVLNGWDSVTFLYIFQIFSIKTII